MRYLFRAITMELSEDAKNEIYALFNWDSCVCDVVDEVIPIIELNGLNEDNIYERIEYALDDALICIDYQWALIKYYSYPTEPMPITDAREKFAKDLANSLGWLL